MTLMKRMFGDDLDVYASWNGATEVREWLVRTASGKAGGKKNGRVLARSARTGFETKLTIKNTAGLQIVWAEALDAKGKIIGSTDVVDMSSGDVTIGYEGSDDMTEDGRSGNKTASWQDAFAEQSGSNVGMVLALVGGGLVGFAAVVYGAVMAWRRYRTYDRLQSDDFDVHMESEEYLDDELVFAPEASMSLHPEAWKESKPGVGFET